MPAARSIRAIVERPTRRPTFFNGALNPRVPPRRILRRHPDDQRSKARLQTGGTQARTAIRPLPRHELAVPPEDRVRRHECRDLGKHSAPKPPSKFRETTPLIVVEP
jgi:hypothetical protein